jgi:hypothetical protein
MASRAFADLIEVDQPQEDAHIDQDLTSELLPETIAVSLEGSKGRRRKSCLETLFCRRKMPSVRDSLAVVGLRSALLVGKLEDLTTMAEIFRHEKHIRHKV